MTESSSRRTCLLLSNGHVRHLGPTAFRDIDRLRTEPGNLIWLDVANPEANDLALLRDELDVHALAIEDLDHRGQRPKLDAYGDQHVVVAYEVRQREGATAAEDGLVFGEIHLFAGPGYLVSVRWDDSAAVAVTRGRFERGSVAADASAGGLLYAVLDAIVDGYFPLIDGLNDELEDLEVELLRRPSGESALRRLLALKRTMLELRRVVAPLREVANALLRREVPIIDEATLPFYNDLYDHLVRVIESLDLLRDLAAAAMDANLAATSNSLNAVMKRLTAITVILMVPTLIAGIYGMNFDVMPELAWPLGYPFALVLMGASVLGAVLFFRRHGWF